jgi:integrase
MGMFAPYTMPITMPITRGKVMAKTTDHLQRRGNQFYLKMSIPRNLRRFFLSSAGKPLSQIQQPLGSSLEHARLERDRRVAKYRKLFARLYAGEQLTPEQVKAAMSFDKEAEGRRLYQEALTALRAGVDADVVFGGRLDAEAEELIRRGETDPATARQPVLVAKLLAVNARSGELLGVMPTTPITTPPIAPTSGGETISQAAEAWIKEMTRDKSAAPRDTTLDGHRLRVRAFVDKCGDLPLTSITRAMANDFLSGLDVSNRTRNAYATTLKCVFECARRRGRFTGDNPFDGMKAKVAGSSYEPFTVAELQTLFDALPRDTAPAKHSPETALPWAALIAAFSGMRLEEIAQLRTSDIREEAANGATVTVIDIHNGGTNKLKNETAARLIPVHSALVHAGLLDYVAALPKAGPLFPGLTRRASKGGKIGARLGEIFRKQLMALGLKRDGLCFHSFRHTVAGRLDASGVPQSDAARVLGHAVAGMSYGTYSQAGPGLKRVAAVVEQITYEGLLIPRHTHVS